MSSENQQSIPKEWTRLRQMRKAEDVDGLLRELKNPRETHGEVWGREVTQTIRERAIRELQKLNSPRAVKPIAHLLDDRAAVVRTDAAIALGRLGDPHVGDLLVKALEDPDEMVVGNAARSLGQLHFKSAVPSLLRLLSHPNIRIQLIAAKALARIGDRSATEPLKEALKKQGWSHPVMRVRLQRALLALRFTR
jgi:HEAT repeat protein